MNNLKPFFLSPRRTSLCLDASSPAPSADRLSVTFALEEEDQEELSDQQDEVEKVPEGPLATIVDTIKKTIPTAHGLR